MRADNFDIDALINSMVDTCESLTSALELNYPLMTSEDLTQAELDKIDEEIFCCEECGWWCHVSEQSSGGECDEVICEDCYTL